MALVSIPSLVSRGAIMLKQLIRASLISFVLLLAVNISAFAQVNTDAAVQVQVLLTSFGKVPVTVAVRQPLSPGEYRITTPRILTASNITVISSTTPTLGERLIALSQVRPYLVAARSSPGDFVPRFAHCPRHLDACRPLSFCGVARA